MISISLLQHQYTVIHDCGAMMLSTKASFSSELEQKRQKRGYLTLRPGAGPITLDPDKIRWTRAFASLNFPPFRLFFSPDSPIEACPNP